MTEKKNNDIAKDLDTPVVELPVVVTENTALQTAATPTDIVNQVTLIQNVMRDVMKLDIHYGVIPGTGGKPTLLKPGAEKLVLTFRLDPQYTWEKELMENGHRSYEFECTLYHIDSGKRLGSGTGICSTMEKKYRWRNKKHKCPFCGNESVIKGKAEYGGGWLCWKKNDGCGAKFNDGDPTIENQEVGKIENPDIADCWNTVKKMAKKRAFVDAVLTVTAASDIFTQDVEELPREMLGNNTSKENMEKAKEKEADKANFNFLKAIRILKRELLKHEGKKEGTATYHKIVKKYGVEKSNEITDRKEQGKFWRELSRVVAETKDANHENDLPDFGGIDAEYERLVTLDTLTPEQVDAFFELCDPREKIKTDDDYRGAWSSERYADCVAWIYKQYKEVKQ